MTRPLTQGEKSALLDGLESVDAEVRRLAVEQLSLLPVAEALDPLSRSLGDHVWRVRKAAVGRLVRCADHSPVQEMLIASLSDGDNPGRRNSAMEALVACGARVTERLIREIRNPDVDVRKLVVDALAAIGDPDSTDSLVEALADPDANVRAAAAEALAVVGGHEQVGHLVRIATAVEEDVLVRLSALRSLTRMEAGLSVAVLAETLEEPLLHAAASELLGHSEDPAVDEVLIKGLSSTSRSTSEASMAALLRRLARLDGSAADDFRRRLRDAARANEQLVARACERLEGSNLGTRMVLIQFLGLLEDSRVVVPILRAGLDDAIEELADATLEALGPLCPTAIEATWETLDNHLRRRACGVLGRLDGDVVERLLADALDAKDPELRCAAATALGQGAVLDRVSDLVRRLEVSSALDDRDSQEEVSTIVRAIVQIAERSEAAEAGVDIQLIEVLSSRLVGAAEPVRLAIAQVLALLGREQDREAIVYLLKDESAAVRRAAVQGLGRFEFARTREALRLALGDESSSVRTAAAGVLGDFDDGRVVEELQRLIEDGDPRVRAVTLRSVGRFYRRVGQSVDEAYALLARGLGADAIVALASLEALKDVGGEGAAALAASVLDRPEPEVVRAAVACIGVHGDEADLSDLIAQVAHPEWSVRAEVVDVLAERACRKAVPALIRRLEIEEDAFVREAIMGALRRLET